MHFSNLLLLESEASQPSRKMRTIFLYIIGERERANITVQRQDFSYIFAGDAIPQIVTAFPN